MSLFSSQLQVHHAQGVDRPSATRKRIVLLRQFINFLLAVSVGSKRAAGYDLILDGEAGAKAVASAAFSGGSGTVGVTINGVAVTVTWATSDIASMTVLCAAINASVAPLVQYTVQASNLRSQVTVGAVLTGSILRLGQYDFTGVATANLVQNWGDFSTVGTPTNIAANLATAINTHPLASKYWIAGSSGTLLTIWLLSTPSQADGSTSTAMLTTTPATITIAAQPAAAAVAAICSYRRDRLANCISLVASGTGSSVSSALLLGGAGGNAIPFQESV